MTDGRGQIDNFPGISDDKILAFSEVLAGIKDTSEKTIVPILKKIEANTSFLKKPSSDKTVVKTVPAVGTFPKQRPILGHRSIIKNSENSLPMAEAVKISKSEVTDKKNITSNPKIVAVTADKELPLRNAKGRFVSSKEKSQEATAESDNAPGKERGRLGTLAAFGVHMAKGGFNDKKGTMMEAVGRGALGPAFDAIMEVKDKYDQFKDAQGNLKDEYSKFKEKNGVPTETSTVVKQQGGGRDEKGRFQNTVAANSEDDTDKIIKELMKSDMSDEERHKELVKAILQKEDSQKNGKSSSSNGLPDVKQTGPGSTMREKIKKAKDKFQLPTGVASRSTKMPGMQGGDGIFGKLGTMATRVGPMLAALPLGTIAAGIAAVGAVSAAGYSAFTGKDNIISQFAQLLGLVPKIQTDANGKITGGRVNDEKVDPNKLGAVSEKYESGGRGAGTVSSGINDKGGVSYGTHQMNTKDGVAQDFVNKSRYKDQFAGLTAGTPEFTAKWKEIAANDPSFGQAQHDYIKQTHYDPTVTKATNAGFNVNDRGVQEALWSQGVQHGQAGNQIIINNAAKNLSARYGDMESAPAEEQIKALYGARQTYAVKYASADATVNRYADEMYKAIDVSRATSGGAQPKTKIAAAETAPAQTVSPTKSNKKNTQVAKKAEKKPEPKKEPETVEGESEREKAAEVEVESKPQEAKVEIAEAKPESKTEAKQPEIATATVPALVQAARNNKLAEIGSKLVKAGVGSLEAKAVTSDMPITTAIKAEVEPKLPEIATATVPSPVQEGRNNKLAEIRSKLAEAGGATSLEATAISPVATSTIQPIASAIAADVPRIKQPERINPEAVASPNPVSTTANTTNMEKGGSPASSADKLVIDRGDDKKSSGNSWQINPEFDDTMLTLMAYDRI